MPTRVYTEGDHLVRHERVDDAPGNAMRQYWRDRNGGTRRRDGSDPFNEAFSFTQDEWELLKRTNPELFDDDPSRRHRAWKNFAATRVGQALRVK